MGGKTKPPKSAPRPKPPGQGDPTFSTRGQRAAKRNRPDGQPDPSVRTGQELNPSQQSTQPKKKIQRTKDPIEDMDIQNDDNQSDNVSEYESEPDDPASVINATADAREATAVQPNRQPANKMHLITSEQMAAVTKIITETAAALRAGQLSKPERLARAAGLGNAAAILSYLPVQQQQPNNMDKVLRSLVNDMQQLKKSINDRKANDDFPPLPRINQCDRTCIIDPTPGIDYSKIAQLRQDPALVQENCRITNVVTSKSGKYVVKLASEADQQKFIDHCKSQNVPARKMKPRKHRFILKGIPDTEQYDSEDRIADEMFSRHDHGDTLKKSYQPFKLFKTANDKQALVFYLDEEASDLLKTHRDFWLGGDRHRAAPYVHPIQCFKCHEMDHVATNCPHAGTTVDKCGRCGQIGHDRKECLSSTKHCVLCTNDPSLQANAGSHCARDGVCPIRRKWIKGQQQLVWP